MGILSGIVDLLAGGVFGLSQVFGGNLGWAILSLSVMLRLAYLPLTYRRARRALHRRQQLAALQPALSHLKNRYADDPHGLATATAELFKQQGLSMFDGKFVLGSLLQLPVFAGMYAAVRQVLATATSSGFLWITNLARPDRSLALIVTALLILIGLVNPNASGDSSRWLALVPAGLGLVILVKLSAGFGLYWFGSGMVNFLEALLLKRRTMPSDAAVSGT